MLACSADVLHTYYIGGHMSGPNNIETEYECDSCGKLSTQCVTLWAYGMEGDFCPTCRGTEDIEAEE